jgi:hypothetical protein
MNEGGRNVESVDPRFRKPYAFNDRLNEVLEWINSNYDPRGEKPKKIAKNEHDRKGLFAWNNNKQPHWRILSKPDSNVQDLHVDFSPNYRKTLSSFQKYQDMFERYAITPYSMIYSGEPEGKYSSDSIYMYSNSGFCVFCSLPSH